MSDFDKEAEREKLREKYGEEQEDRETTQQMSELLLQGATMTNRHCDQCGDPVFRHEGQEFCPTCQVEVGEGAQESADEGTDDGQSSQPSEPADAHEGSNAEASGTERQSPATAETGSPIQRSGETHDRTDPRVTGEAAGDQSPASSGSPTPADRTQNRRDRLSTPTQTGGEGVGDAQRSLERTLARFARRAEETDDPRAAQDHLAAAREAAETLAALRK